MKNSKKLFGFIALVAVIGFGIIACDTGGGGGGGDPQKATYVSTDSNGNKYTLEINETGKRSARSAAQTGDTFKLTVEYWSGNFKVTVEYEGNVAAAQASGTSVSLNLNINSEPITITIVGTEMTVITGTIVNSNGQPIANNPTVTPVGGGGAGADSSLNATWLDSDSNQIVLFNGSFVMYNEGFQLLKGNYSRNGVNVIFTTTHTWGPFMDLEYKWYSKADLSALGASGKDLDDLYSPWSGKVNGNQITVTWLDVTDTLTKFDSGSGGNPNLSIDGDWQGEYSGFTFTISGNQGIFKEINWGVWKEIQNKGLIKVGDQIMRNIVDNGDGTWSGEHRSYYNDYTLAGWKSITIKLSTDGQTISGTGFGYERP